MQDKRVGLVPIKCGLCMECAAARAAEWKSRLLEEVRWNKTKGNFVTLTFSNEGLTEIVSMVLEENKELKGFGSGLLIVVHFSLILPFIRSVR